jgi:dephospho-CoA kinase
MICVGLTGGIATGKSTVARMFAKQGVAVIDADEMVRELQKPGSIVYRAIVEAFGPVILHGDGTIDRKVLGTRVFRDPTARRALEAILHPQVYRVIQEWFGELAGAGARLGVADIPLLFETRHGSDFDVVVVTACDPEEQVRRVMLRNGASEQEARARLEAQMPIAEKIKQCKGAISDRKTERDAEATNLIDKFLQGYEAMNPKDQASVRKALEECLVLPAIRREPEHKGLFVGAAFALGKMGAEGAGIGRRETEV